MKIRSLVALLAAVLLPLASCSKGTPSPSSEAASGTLPAALADTGDMSKIAKALTDTGIAGIFQDKGGSYTLLAPTDAAFAKFKDADKLFSGDEGRAALAELLRQQILPGYLQPDDISAAIKTAKDGKVTMTTMDGSDLQFSMDNGTILVTSPDGVTAHVTGKPVKGEKSLAIPVDAVLKKPE